MNASPQNLWDQACAALEHTPQKALQQAETLLQHHDGAHIRLLAGSAALRSGAPETAVAHLHRATELAPNDPQTWSALGAALIESHQPQAALAPLQRALDLAPQHPQALFNLAAAQIQQGQKEAAWGSYQVLLQHHPDHLGVLEQLIRLGIELQRSTESVDAFRRLQQRAPGRAAPLTLPLLEALSEQGNEETLRSLLPQQDYDTQLHLGNRFLERGDTQAAQDIYQCLTQSHPQRPEAFNNLAIVLGRQGREKDGIALLQKALEHHPHAPELHATLAALQLDADQIETAEARARQALEQDPSRTDARATLAAALQRQQRHDEAEQLLKTALQEHPSYTPLWYNLGTLLMDRGQTQEGLAAFEKALSLDPHHRDARANLGFAQLLLGQFDQAWGNYFHRARHIDIPDALTPIEPQRDHHGLKVLLTRSQGLGDELFYLRFAPALRAQGAHLSYRTHSGSKLIPLLQRSGLFEEIIEDERTPATGFDIIYAVDDLPLILGAGTGDHPPPLALAADNDKRRHWTQRLSELGPPPYLGLTWRAGSREHNHGIHRFLYKEIPLEALAPVARRWPGTVLSLQRQPEKSETEHLARLSQRPIHDLSRINDDLEDALALLDLLDAYVGVSNTNIHLLAGLGKGAHVLIPHPSPDWRWMAQGDISPWFPGFNIYRQQADGKWTAALNALQEALYESSGA